MGGGVGGGVSFLLGRKLGLLEGRAQGEAEDKVWAFLASQQALLVDGLVVVPVRAVNSNLWHGWFQALQDLVCVHLIHAVVLDCTDEQSPALRAFLAEVPVSLTHCSWKRCLSSSVTV